jgi:hypothetical protein
VAYISSYDALASVPAVCRGKLWFEGLGSRL